MPSPSPLCYTITMEYETHVHPDPFNIERTPDRGDLSAFIHPVIRRYPNGSFQGEHHSPEALPNRRYQEQYVTPFLPYLAHA